MNFLRNNFANLLTLGNLLFGCIGIVLLLSGNYSGTAWCIVGSLILDFFDGFVARALRANSDLGVQLDSLADMVSFGFLPGIVLYVALEPFGNQLFGFSFPFDLKYVGFLITLFSCLRLAIFNTDEDQKYYFKGLNTPSNTIFIFGAYFAYRNDDVFRFLFESPGALLAVTILFSWLLVSPIKMIALKFKSRKLKDNLPKIFLLIGCLALVLVFGFGGVALCILYYILISIIFQNKLA